MSSQAKQTPLFDRHQALKAKIAPFAGWAMPIQYSGIIQEHNHTREKASVFDICHMGEFLLTGARAKEALGKAITHNLATLKVGRCRYGFLLNEKGGVKDDLIVYCLAEDEYMLVVNGACTESDFNWIQGQLPADVSFTDLSAETAKIDLQGPMSLDVLEAVLESDPDFVARDLPYFGFGRTAFAGSPLLVSRTGYTGELGYELYIDADKAAALWDALLEDQRVAPAGLGARDTLRLEMGLPLYGQDLDEDHNPTEAGYGMLLKSEADYTGKGPDKEVRHKLLGLELEGRRSARHHDRVCLPSGQDVGVVTSGSFAPSLGKAIALAYVDAAHAGESEYLIKAARTELKALVCDLPFYKQGTARLKLK